jgi:hypothetical protein
MCKYCFFCWQWTVSSMLKYKHAAQASDDVEMSQVNSLAGASCLYFLDISTGCLAVLRVMIADLARPCSGCSSFRRKVWCIGPEVDSPTFGEVPRVLWQCLISCLAPCSFGLLTHPPTHTPSLVFNETSRPGVTKTGGFFWDLPDRRTEAVKLPELGWSCHL